MPSKSSVYSTVKYILNQSDPTKDAFKILNKMFFDKEEQIVKVELLDTGEMKVIVKHDLG